MQQILYRIFLIFYLANYFFQFICIYKFGSPLGGGLLIKYSKSGHGNITVSECTSHVMQ